MAEDTEVAMAEQIEAAGQTNEAAEAVGGQQSESRVTSAKSSKAVNIII